ncbi:hypothetical protein [Lamprocystis purpurea]|jgi:hypothetical protein|uniref:hypothetical protein n=1 Tax=Lamprocystis purpurea TaxID=61598 RepID=UPI00037CD949|nr:hypothetical protein [Lamprocystis purpurea]
MKEIRRLIYVPILHAQDDSGRAASNVSENAKMRKSKESVGADRTAVEQMWQGIAAKITELNLPWEKTRIYQDGTPVCGNETALAERLAERGSTNYTFLIKLMKKGAVLEGTEDMELLIQEYDLLNKLLIKKAVSDRDSVNAEYQEKSRKLLALRDQFIAGRIAATLQEGELPIVFMGVMHRLDKLLEKEWLMRPTV